MPLSALFELGSAGRAQLGTPASGLDLKVEALQMLSAAAAVSNGDNQIDFEIDHGLDGLSTVQATLVVGERPQSTTWFALSEQEHAMVSTAQAKLFLDVRLEGLSRLTHDLVRLPLYLELASAEARITDVVCESGETKAKRVDVDVRTGILSLRIADLDGSMAAPGKLQQFRPARILDAYLVDATAEAHTSLASGAPKTLRFHQFDIGSDNPKTVSTTDALGTALETAIRDLDMDVRISRFSLLSADLVETLLGAALAEAVEPVDELVFDLASALGIGLGEADVWVHDARCNRSVLVQ